MTSVSITIKICLRLTKTVSATIKFNVINTKYILHEYLTDKNHILCVYIYTVHTYINVLFSHILLCLLLPRHQWLSFVGNIDHGKNFNVGTLWTFMSESFSLCWPAGSISFASMFFSITFSSRWINSVNI